MKNSKKVLAIIIVISLILPSVIWPFIKNENWPQIDENRALAEWSSEEISIKKIEEYYNDHFPFRSMLIYLKQKISNKTEKAYREWLKEYILNTFYSYELEDPLLFNGGEYIGDNVWELDDNESHNYEYVTTVEPGPRNLGYNILRCSDCGKEKKGDYYNFVNKKYFTKTNADRVVLGRDNWLFLNDFLDSYSGKNLLSNSIEEYTSVYGELNKICKDQGKELVVMISPLKQSVYSEEMPTVRKTGDTNCIEFLVQELKNKTDINIFYPKVALQLLKEEWQLYKKFDTHWNRAGGFSAVQMLYKSINLPYTSLYELDKINAIFLIEATERNLIKMGSLDTNYYTGDIDYNICYKENIKYDEEVDFENWDSHLKINMYTNDYYSIDKKIAFIGDSFRLDMMGFMAKDFKQSIFCHRYHVTNQLLSEKEIAMIKESDIIVFESLEQYYSNEFGNQLLDANSLIDLLLMPNVINT